MDLPVLGLPLYYLYSCYSAEALTASADGSLTQDVDTTIVASASPYLLVNAAESGETDVDADADARRYLIFISFMW